MQRLDQAFGARSAGPRQRRQHRRDRICAISEAYQSKSALRRPTLSNAVTPFMRPEARAAVRRLRLDGAKTRPPAPRASRTSAMTSSRRSSAEANRQQACSPAAGRERDVTGQRESLLAVMLHSRPRAHGGAPAAAR